LNLAPPLLAVEGLSVDYRLTPDWPWQARPQLRALQQVTFELRAGETLGVVGESGCGKSTLARVLVGLQAASAGSLRFEGRELRDLPAAQWRRLRRDIQMVFQDPLASLDPRMTVAAAIEQPLRALCPQLDAGARRRRVDRMLERVGLAAAHGARYPHELSGGQCQRVGIGRALVVEPRLLICDEPVSALDVSVQAQIVNLLMDLQREQNLALLFIAHDLALVRQMSDRVLVLYLGRVMELAPGAALFSRPQHPYTQALLAAVPGTTATARQPPPEGEAPSPLQPPPGCVFSTRCRRADGPCRREAPPLRSLAEGAAVACHHAGPA
jgi:oligopeptide transport system ATP-binding protein